MKEKKPYVIVIPARMQSTRLPGKPLIHIMGKSMLQRTYERCMAAFPPENIFVATDDVRIEKHCMEGGMQVVITSPDCLTGTDRIAEFAQKIPAANYINVQGDEPIINPKDIRTIQKAMEKYPGLIVNGYAPLENEEEYRSFSIPKVVCRPDGRLLYMSRAAIPSNKRNQFVLGWKQICIYGFPAASLNLFTVAKGTKTPLENEEDIEILRFLELGLEVQMIPLIGDSIAVDTPEDVRRVEEKLKLTL